MCEEIIESSYLKLKPKYLPKYVCCIVSTINVFYRYEMVCTCMPCLCDCPFRVVLVSGNCGRTAAYFFYKTEGTSVVFMTWSLFLNDPFYGPEGTSGGILKSHRPSVRLSVRPSVTNRVSSITHELLKQIK